jgi:hypothetical protein
MSGVVLDRDFRQPTPPRLRRIEIETRAGAHAALTGRLFERIVRLTWRIAAFEKQPELAATQSELACMGSAFSYDCDQSSSA